MTAPMAAYGRRVGLLGRSLSHSYSPLIHKLIAGDRYSYRLLPTEPEALPALLRSEAWDGLNVTVPYKRAVLPYLDELSPVAQRLGAVNTIIRRKDGRLFGDNTDYAGFASWLDSLGLAVRGMPVLVLGTGGAAVTVRAVLEARGARVTLVSRTGEVNYRSVYAHCPDARLLVNATPVGMYPACGEKPLALEGFAHLEAVLDLVYNPYTTSLMAEAAARGIPAYNGLYMLTAQAAAAAELFTGEPLADEALCRRVTEQVAHRTRHIQLIGMPGCGKTTVAHALGQATGRPVLDLDELIRQSAGMSIPEIFRREGEDGFRRRETAALEQAVDRRFGGETPQGGIIACGGGTVLRPENRVLLRRNGYTLRLTRELSRLETAGRPLSETTGLDQMAQEREPFYAACADATAHNDGRVAETVRELLHLAGLEDEARENTDGKGDAWT